MDTLPDTGTDTVANAISNATNWREATNCLLDYWISRDRCFSSGEVAAALRTHRMDLRFSVTSLGEYLRDLFYQGTMPAYIQHPRYTEGNVGRTPAGVLVFVYGPDEDACELHEFEVNIPRPGTPNGTDLDGPQTPAPQRAAPVADSAPRPVPTDLPDAYGSKDGRCYVPRKAVDAFLGAAGVNLRYGDDVHVTFTDWVAEITASATPTSTPYNIWTTTGRVAFRSPDGEDFPDGAKYAVTVTAKCITVDIANPR